MKPYQKIWQHNENGAKVGAWTLPEDLDGNPAQDCPGVRILARADAIAGVGRTTFDHLYQAFNEDQFRGTWRWIPSGNGSGANSYGLLDDDKKTGQCEHFAKNLVTLARAPRPYGLGLQGVVKVTYKGANDEGFVSVHNGVHLGLTANVSGPQGYNGDSLRYWEDHKVVQYAGQIYDPCYRTAPYPLIQSMARFELTGVYVRTDQEGLWDPGDIKTLALQTEGKTAERSTHNNRFYFFRRMTLAESALRNGAAYDGPLSETDVELMRRDAGGVNVVG